VVRDLVFKAAERVKWTVCVVGNSWMRIPTSPLFEMVVVPGGFDAVDDHIAEHVKLGDLVITSDVPLAARVVESKAKAISTRGDVFDEKNIAERLSMRNLMQELRSAGEVKGGHNAFNDGDKKKFADSFDKLLSALVRSKA
jgi:uncharacterized protein YaiI (UPF0178 family)